MSIILTCNVTGKTVKWSNQKIIDAKVAEYGSLEAFQKAYVSRGANKKPKQKSALSIASDGEVDLMRSILMEGVKLAPSLSTKHMSNEEYVKMYEGKVRALEEAGASASEIGWMKQRLERWRG